MAMTLVSTVTVGSGGAASIEFTGIPATGKDLLILVSIRGNAGNQYRVQFNGDTGNNYPYKLLYGNGASVFNDQGSNGPYDFINDSSTTSNTFSSSSIYVANYAGSTNKSMSLDSVTENNATTAYQAIQAASWSNTNAITSVKLNSVSALQHSTASLYIIS
jgi:hypothetical protein